MMGPPGTGKSALASQLVSAFASRGEHAAMYTFEESLDTTIARAEALGAPLRDCIERGLVTALQINPAELTPGQFIQRVRTAVQRDDARIVVVDSLNGYLNAMPQATHLLSQLHELFAFLSQHGVVTVLTVAQHGLMGPMSAPVDASYLADTVLLLRFFEAAGRIRKAISVVKRRTGAHEDMIREFALGRGGLQIGEPLSQFRGVLTGVPTYTGETEPLMSRRAADGK
jgi:circadian clock protein KaiC